jgi:hypothetical protein
LIVDMISDQLVDRAPANNRSFLIKSKGNLLSSRLPFLLNKVSEQKPFNSAVGSSPKNKDFVQIMNSQ